LALFHTRTQIIGRSSGRSVIAAAAYRSTSTIKDERAGKTWSYEGKPDLLHSAILLPAGAPDTFADRSALWNAVEAIEKRKDAQLAREFEFALPHELSDAANIDLARAFVQEAFVKAGMIADLNIHKPVDAKGQAKPHAHVLLTTRDVSADGFGPKNRAWNDKRLPDQWRDMLAARTNEVLVREGIEARVDPRSYAERGIELQPQTKIGWKARKLEKEGKPAERTAEHRKIASHNGKALIANPWLGLDYLTEHTSTFTRHDIARFASRNTDGAEQFQSVLAKLMAHPDLVKVGTGKRGEERFSTRRMVAIERQMAEHAAALAQRQAHRTDASFREQLQSVDHLGPEQRKALEHITKGDGLSLVLGFAGTGKSRMLGDARQVWEAAGYRVRGAALSGIAAESLQNSSGIESRTLASLEWHWSRGKDKLTSRDVLAVDEAGMVGSRQMERVLAAARAAGAKVVLVGDPEQLQAIEAGSAFRALADRHGVASLTVVMRQAGRHAAWMREATKELATARTAKALARYDEAGMVHAAETREQAMAALIEQWDRDRLYRPERSQLILAYTRDDVAALNELAREKMKASGSLGEEVTMRTERGKRTFAVGERVMFLRNDRALGVKNGSLGVLRGIEAGKLSIQLDDGMKVGGGQIVSFDPRQYTNLEHGYASTIHKSQGVTVARTKVMAHRAFDRHASYVAMSRHRGRVDLHYGREDFTDRVALGQRLGRERAKDTTLDYSAGLDGRTRDAIRTMGAKMRTATRENAADRTERQVEARYLADQDLSKQAAAQARSEAEWESSAEGKQARAEDRELTREERNSKLAGAIKAIAARMKQRERDAGRGR